MPYSGSLSFSLPAQLTAETLPMRLLPRLLLVPTNRMQQIKRALTIPFLHALHRLCYNSDAQKIESETVAQFRGGNMEWHTAYTDTEQILA